MEELSMHFINYFNMLLHRYGLRGLGISMFAESMASLFFHFFIVTAWTLLEKESSLSGR